MVLTLFTTKNLSLYSLQARCREYLTKKKQKSLQSSQSSQQCTTYNTKRREEIYYIQAKTKHGFNIYLQQRI